MPRPIPEDIAFSSGQVQGGLPLHKFGKAPDFDIADLFVDIWDGANDAGIAQMSYTFSTSAAIDTISSSAVADTEILEVEGVDTNWALVTQQKTLTGQTKAVLDTPLLHVFRIRNVGSNILTGTVYCYEDTPIVIGVPTDKTKIRAMISLEATISNNQTLMSIYAVPAGKELYLDSWYADLAAVAFPTNSFSKIKLQVKPFEQVFQLKDERTLVSSGSSGRVFSFNPPFPVPEKSLIKVQANTSIDSVSIDAGFHGRLITI